MPADTRRVGFRTVLLAGDLWVRHTTTHQHRVCRDCGEDIPVGDDSYRPAVYCIRRLGRKTRICLLCVALKLADAARKEKANAV